MFSIYKITNLKNNKIYIGQTSRTIYERFEEHCMCALSFKLNTHFAKAIRKYGKDSFKIETIEDSILDKETANKREIYYISYYESTKRGVGYNSTPGGEGGNTYLNKSVEEMAEIKSKISHGNSGENNGKHTVIYLKDTITGEELRFGSLSSCERYLNNMGFYFSRRTYEDCAKKNRYYGIQNILFGKYIFRFDGDSFLKWTDYPSKSGTFPYAMINTLTGEEFIGICKNECLEHFGFHGRCDKQVLEKKGYIMKKLEKYEYKNNLGK